MGQVRQIIEEALASGQNFVDEYQSKKVLAAYDVPVVREILAIDLDKALDAAKEIGFPVVLKVCGANVAHKTELNLVEVGISSPAELEQAFMRLQPSARKVGADILVQKMIKGDRELVVGMSRDPGFGPCVMLGLGGVFTEVLSDVSFRVAPLSLTDAQEMMGELKASRLMHKFRGMPAVDTDILSECLVALGNIALEHPEIKEIDINPMIIEEGRPVAVDALVVLAESTPMPESVPPKENLHTLFSPESVAVIGASSKPGKSGNDVVKNILANAFSGQLFLVNPRGGEILGQKVYTSIAELPEGIDQAIIILPAKANPQAIRDCKARGIKTIVMAAGGFAEVDDSGLALQQETLAAIQETGIRALGPNTSGHISTPAHYTSSFFPLGQIPKGNISYIAQTGNFATHTMRYIASAEHYGVARVVGMGNKLDIEESELLEYLAEDRETKAIFMYLESIKHPRRFLKAAAMATRKKPVVLLKGGASPEGASAAVAHTAALASDDRIIDGALNQAGVVRIFKYSQLFQAAKALAKMPLPKGNRVSFSAPSGAMLVCMTDLCRRNLHLEVPQFAEHNRKRLQEISPPYIKIRNPVDIWPAAAVSGVEFAYGEAIEAGLSDPNIDAVVSILMLTDETGIPSYDFLPALAEKYPHKPLYLTFSGQKEHMETAKAYLEPRGIPTFQMIEEPFEVLDILCRCQKALSRPSE